MQLDDEQITDLAIDLVNDLLDDLVDLSMMTVDEFLIDNTDHDYDQDDLDEVHDTAVEYLRNIQKYWPEAMA